MFKVLRAFRVCLGIEVEVEVEEVKEKKELKKEDDKIQDDSTFLSGGEAEKNMKNNEMKKEKKKKKAKQKIRGKEPEDKSPVIEAKEVVIEMSEFEQVKEKKPLKSILKKVSRFRK